MCQESDEDSPLCVKRTTKDPQTLIKKKNLFKVIDVSSDDEKDKANEDCQVLDSLAALKEKEECKNDEKKGKEANHLDDSNDFEPLLDKYHNSLETNSKYALIDEKTDEDDNNNKSTSDDGVWVNINELPWGYDDVLDLNKYIDDEAKEDLVNYDINNGQSQSEEYDKDSFIDDESLGYDTTDPDDTDDDF